MIEFYSPKDLKEHKKFSVSNGELYSLPPDWAQKEWEKWNWEKKMVALEEIPDDAIYEGFANHWGLPLEQGDTNSMGNVSFGYIRPRGRNISPNLDDEAVKSKDRDGQIWPARALFKIWGWGKR